MAPATRLMDRAAPLFWRADPMGRWTWSCTEWTAFTGLSEVSSRGDGWLEAVHPADRPAAAARWIIGAGCGTERPPLRLRRAGGEGYGRVRPRAAHALDPDGTLREWIGTMQVGVPVARRDPDGLRHHLRNTLALVRSVTRRMAGTTDTVDHYATHFEGRLDAFARVQDALIRNRGGGVDLEGMIREELLTHRVKDAALLVEGPPLRLIGRAAEIVALALHELAINAVKFGALTAPRGTLALSWTVDRGTVPPTLRFRWRETGVTAVAAAPRRIGFGTELIERHLPYDLKAVTRLDFRPGEVCCTIAIPLTGEVAILDPA